MRPGFSLMGFWSGRATPFAKEQGVDEIIECLRCGEPMEAGFLLDRAHGNIHQQMWCPGEPRPAFFGGVKTSHATTGTYVVTYRCAACGYLESYAPPKTAEGEPRT